MAAERAAEAAAAAAKVGEEARAAVVLQRENTQQPSEIRVVRRHCQNANRRRC